MSQRAIHKKYPKRSVDTDDLNEQQMLFVLEYIKDLDAKRAGLAAGYASADSGHRLLAKPNVSRQIAVELERLHKTKAITNELVLEQLYFALSRTSDDFIDPNTGHLVSDLRLLSTRAKNMVEGVKQKVKTWTDSEGEIHTEVETEIKFVSKEAAINLAMRHKGLIEAGKSDGVTVNINLNDFLIASSNETPLDPIEQKLRLVENKADKLLGGDPPIQEKKGEPTKTKKVSYSAKELIEEEL